MAAVHSSSSSVCVCACVRVCVRVCVWGGGKMCILVYFRARERI